MDWSKLIPWVLANFRLIKFPEQGTTKELDTFNGERADPFFDPLKYISFLGHRTQTSPANLSSILRTCHTVAAAMINFQLCHVGEHHKLSKCLFKSSLPLRPMKMFKHFQVFSCLYNLIQATKQRSSTKQKNGNEHINKHTNMCMHMRYSCKMGWIRASSSGIAT